MRHLHPTRKGAISIIFGWIVLSSPLVFANDCIRYLRMLTSSGPDHEAGLIEDLKSPNANVRWRATKTLLKVQSAALMPILVKGLADSDSRVRDEITEALRKSTDAELFYLLEKEFAVADPSYRRGIAESLWKLQNPKVLPIILKANSDEDPDVRWFAVLAMGDLKINSTVSHLMEKLADKDSRVRWVAVKSLIKFDNPNHSSLIAPLIMDDSSDVKTSAAWALGELGAIESASILKEALKSEDFQLRWAATEALGKIKSHEAYQALLEALEDQDEFIKSQAIKSIVRLQEPESISKLAELLGMPKTSFSLQETLKSGLRELKASFKDISLKKQIDLILLDFDFKDHMKYLTGESLDDYLFQPGVDPYQRLKKLLSDIQDHHPYLLPTGNFDFLSDQVKKMNSSLQLLQLFFQESLFEMTEKKNDLENPRDSLSLLERALGLSLEDVRVDQSLPKPRISKNSLGQFYELTLDFILRVKDRGVLHSLTASNLANKDHFNQLGDILMGLRDVVALKSNEAQPWLILKTQLNLGSTTNSSLEELNFQIQRVRFQEIQALFGETNPDFDLEKIQNLSLRWGDLRPFFTLLSRYRGTKNSDNEIQELYRIFDAVLKDRFFEYKFRGEQFDHRDHLIGDTRWLSSEQEIARNQLSALKTQKNFEDWTQIRTRIHYFDQLKSKVQLENLLDDLKTTVETNLLSHFKNLGTLHPNLKSFIEEVLILKGDYNEKWGVMQALAFKKIEQKEVLKALALEMLMTHDLARFKKILALFKNWLKLPEVALDGIQDIKADIEEIDSKIVEASKTLRKSSAAPRGFIFTTTVQDAKSLLMIGSCIRGASSCQNYQTGTHIQSLLGYVKDAHIQATLSFFINASHFSKPKDYENLLKAQLDQKDVQAEFLPESFQVRFFWNDGESITDVLQTAQRRHILKLGTINGAPGVFLERAYKVNHPAQIEMESQTEEILAEIAESIGGKIKTKSKGSALRIAASRHLGGHYSDAAGGSKTRAYIIR